MENYTIYCTKEQIEKAIKLGASIKINHYPPINGENFMWLSPPEDAIAWNNSTNCLIPTAEQMRGWLESGDIIDCIDVVHEEDGFVFYVEADGIYSLRQGGYLSRPEATLAAIDAALDYLIKSKEK